MKTRGAVLWEDAKQWEVEELDLDGPKAGEVLVQVSAAGLCRSDDHMVEGGMSALRPIIGGHEGAGVVVEVGPGVKDFQEGDHVALSFVPACGKCTMCASGRQNLCDNGATTLWGRMQDGTSRVRARGRELNIFAGIGTFSELTTVSELSLVKVEPDLPLAPVALVSCGVATGWGSAVARGDVRPGDIVVVAGVGGLGTAAVQGARMAGARFVVAVDPVEFKRESAMSFGATHTAPSLEEAQPLVREISWGRMADVVILTPSVMFGELLAPALALTAKAGTCVVTGVAPHDQIDVKLDLHDLAMMQKEVKGTIFGSLNPRVDIPRLLHLYRSGELKLDEMITRTYPLEGINEGYQDMRDGKNIRGVLSMG